MAAPLKIFGTAVALTLGAWRLQLRIDLDEVTDDAEDASPFVLRRRSATPSFAQNDIAR